MAVWRAAVDAVRPEVLVPQALAEPEIAAALAGAKRIRVVGAGKAGAAMSAAVETALPAMLDRLDGWVNVPAGALVPTRRIHLHPARPAG
ncbi:MAG: DUF4147 domain-containing protein, partial [Gemmataceae bacterium]|nr:DUF4147 domain-containing protein [Gemmataceae bacterium]